MLKFGEDDVWFAQNVETVPANDVPSPDPADRVLNHRPATSLASASGVFGFVVRGTTPGEVYTASASIYIPEEFGGRGVALVLSGDASLHQIEADLTRRDCWQSIAVSARMPPARHHAAPGICIWGENDLTIHSTRWQLHSGLDHIKDVARANELSGQSGDGVFRTFESLGNNCELGIVQRTHGYDTPGLFRNVGFQTVEQIIKALECRFEGMFDAGNFSYLQRSNWPDYALHCRRYGFVFHTAIPCDQPILEKTASRNIASFRFMLRKLREDLEQGEKIFVYRSDRTASDDLVVRLHSAIRTYGPGWLLYVRQDASKPRCDLEIPADGLMVASMPLLSNSNPPVIDMASWQRLARLSTSMWRLNNANGRAD
jgi:hypothetical protein